MRGKDEQTLKKIYQHVESALKYCEGCTNLADFENNPMCMEACVFNLMQIGELAKFSLSDELKSQIKTIPWNQLYGMRNRIVHDYMGVDMTIVWDTISEDLPGLKNELEKII